jgi:hypothetical protein
MRSTGVIVQPMTPREIFIQEDVVFDNGFPVSLGAFQKTFQGGDGSEVPVSRQILGFLNLMQTARKAVCNIFGWTR